MQQKFYKSVLGRRLSVTCCLLTTLCLLAAQESRAQAFCDNETVYWLENFGTGITPVTHPDVIPGSLVFEGTGILTAEGSYRVINNSQQRPEWHFSPDHTPGDTDGMMMVINGQSGAFFRHVTTVPAGFLPGPYAASLYLINANTPGTCAPNPLLPNISFAVEYLDQNNNWVQLQNSPVTSSPVPQSANPTWVVLGGVFNLPATGGFTVTQMRVTVSNLTAGGCGNDFAIDDIKLASCPSGGPVPVTFESIQAQLKGSGVLVKWATSSEINNDRFELERSQNGSTWTKIATVKGSGTSQVTNQYQSYDAKPFIGRNLYRIRQVDLDGTAKYSVTVSAQVRANGLNASLLQNPVTDALLLDFLSDKQQQVRVRVTDISGKILLSSSTTVAAGADRKRIPLPSGLSGGTYVLQVLGQDGMTVLREKFLK